MGSRGSIVLYIYAYVYMSIIFVCVCMYVCMHVCRFYAPQIVVALLVHSAVGVAMIAMKAVVATEMKAFMENLREKTRR